MSFRPLHPIEHWLAIRVRLLCIVVFAVGAALPPYVPNDALAFEGESAPEPMQLLLVEDGFLMKSSSLTQQGFRRAYAEGIVHAVQEGESLERLAQRYGIAVDTIKWANTLPADKPIRPGQELIILPVDGVLHTVKRGQTLAKIAELYGVPLEEIGRQNRVEGSFILAGQELIIPGGKPLVSKPAQIAAKPVSPPAAQRGAGAGIAAGRPSQSVAQPSIGVLQMPCNNCFYTQYFHPGHYAVDIQTKGAGPIFAAEDGTVLRGDYGWNGGFGNVIEVDHGNGLVTLYAHNKELYVKSGDRVSRGQMIAWMGNTGLVYGSTGIHVHFEVRVNGVKKNPLLYLQ